MNTNLTQVVTEKAIKARSFSLTPRESNIKLKDEGQSGPSPFEVNNQREMEYRRRHLKRRESIPAPFPHLHIEDSPKTVLSSGIGVNYQLHNQDAEAHS